MSTKSYAVKLAAYEVSAFALQARLQNATEDFVLYRGARARAREAAARDFPDRLNFAQPRLNTYQG